MDSLILAKEIALFCVVIFYLEGVLSYYLNSRRYSWYMVPELVRGCSSFIGGGLLLVGVIYNSTDTGTLTCVFTTVSTPYYPFSVPLIVSSA